MSLRLNPIGVVLLSLIACRAAGAIDFVKESAPQKWIEPHLPEDLPALEYPEYYTDLEKAQAQSSAGRYKLSLITLRGAKNLDPIGAALVKANSLSALGRDDESLAVLNDVKVADDARVQVRRAELLADLGRTDEAIALLKTHLQKHPGSLDGHFQLGAVSEQIGDTQSAVQAYTWFVAKPQSFLDKWQGQGEKAFESAHDVTTIGRAIDRWANLTSAYKDNPSLHNAILNMFVRAYDVIDRGYWPAHVAAAEYFLSHDDKGEAVKEMKAAQNANPRDVRSLAILGRVAIDGFNFDGADVAVEAIREINPNSTDADLLETRNLLAQRRPRDAEAPVRKVLARQPKHLEALGLIAATHALQLHDDETAAALKQVEAVDPDNASAYVEVAAQLAAMRQYPRSAAMYKIAIDRAPWWTSARNGLGLLYTQSGDEDLALSVLDAAHALDPFNVAATNYLRLLDDLGHFARKETAHFIVFYDAKVDPIIPEYFSDYLESAYAEVCGVFRHEPAVKTYIEVFPTHDAFSVRTTGSPWIGTVGASTGRVIAMVAPRKGKSTMGPFNWSQVLRHEFTHTVTLSATENRISHWMTEGLAVYEERVPLRWEWVPMLYDAVKKHELFSMENLTWGFVRPKRPIDRQLAYAQSYWICKYIEETNGHEAILKMLAEFKAGKSQEEVFPKILGRSLTQFTTEFFAWTDREVATWGYDAEMSTKYSSLRTRGESLIQAKQYAEAVTVWEQIAKLRPVDSLPHQRLAGLYLTKAVNQPEKAIEHLVSLHLVELKDNRYAKRIARIYRDIKMSDEGAKYALQAVYIDPYDLDAHQLLAELCEKTGNADGLARERRVIPVLERWQEEAKEKPGEKSE